jgi:hypothetical protein
MYSVGGSVGGRRFGMERWYGCTGLDCGRKAGDGGVDFVGG